MPFTFSKTGPYDLQNFKPVWEKSLQQNLTEFSLGTQITGVVIPEALAFKAAQQITAGLASNAATKAAPATVAASQAAGATVGASTTAAGVGLGALGLASIPLITTGLKVGAGLTALDWLQKNWWIPAVFLGGFIALKYIEKGK